MRLMMNENYKSMDEMRTVVKQELESFEHWSRRLINDEFTKKYGKDYFNYKCSDGNGLIKSELNSRIEERMMQNPKRFPRKIDAILIEDISYFLCRDDFYKDIFVSILKPFFAGQDDVRLRIEKISGVRNKLYHGNNISFREAEQSICYSHDFIDCFNEYYRRVGREKDFNVPQIIKAEDSYGRCQYRIDDTVNDLSTGNGILKLRPGDVYTVYVVVDAVFPKDFYNIVWYMNDKVVGTGDSFTYRINIGDVSRILFVGCSLVTKRQWHRSGGSDDWFNTCIGEILPPIEDLY
jgi:hypothetical protein